GDNLSPDRAQFSRLELTGPLTVRIEGSGAAEIGTMRVEGIAFRAPMPNVDEAAVDRLLLESLRVTVLGTTVGVDARRSPQRLFRPAGLDLNTLPNPTSSLAALTEADVKRIAYDAAVTLASILVDELEEIRGAHTHTMPCGTLRVTPDAARTTTHLDYA